MQTSHIVLDAAPLIYLAKLEALDVLATVPAALVPPVVVNETTRPAIALRHPDAVAIESAIAEGLVTPCSLTAEETKTANDLVRRIPAMHAGEAEVLAIAIARGHAATIFERRAQRVAEALGVRLVDVVDLLVGGTADGDLLEHRVRRFGRLVEMRLPAMEALVERIRSNR